MLVKNNEYESIQRVRNLSEQSIKSNRDVELAFECLNDKELNDKYLNDLDYFINKVKVATYEYNNTKISQNDTVLEESKSELMFIGLIPILNPILELKFKCAKFLVMNNNSKKLRELFNLNSKVVNDKLSFKLAKDFILEGNINGIHMLPLAYSITYNISELIYGEKKNNLFHFAIENNQFEILEFLFNWLVKKEIIDEKNHLGDTLLESAVKYSTRQLLKNGFLNNDIVNFLIENLDIKSLSTTNSQKRNIVHVATGLGNIDALKVLITKLKNSSIFSLINDLDKECGTPLQLAINGASIDRTGVPEATLDWISEFYTFNELLYNNLIYKRNLIDVKSDIAKILVKNYEEIVKVLLSNLTMEQINSKDYQGDSPTHECVVRSNDKILKLILETKKVDINAQNNQEDTALHCAVNMSSLPIISLLLAEEKIDLTVKNKKGLTAGQLISSAVRTDNKEIAELFIKAYQKQGIQPPIFLNDVSNNVAAVRQYINQRVNYSVPNPYLGYYVVDSGIKHKESCTINEISNFRKTNDFDKLLDSSNTSVEFSKNEINSTIITTGYNDNKQIILNNKL